MSDNDKTPDNKNDSQDDKSKTKEPPNESPSVSKSDLESLRDTLTERLQEITKTKDDKDSNPEITKLNGRIDQLNDAITSFGKELISSLFENKKIESTENKMVVTTEKGSTQSNTETSGPEKVRSFWRRMVSG
ncbi:MAG: hypothetical protein ACRDFB_05455 [Rhabdochlamydiaceae bacterium]